MSERENASKSQGRVATYLGWPLFILAALAFVGMLAFERGVAVKVRSGARSNGELAS